MLDAGDALAGDGGLGDQTEGKVIVDGMNLMGYDAMALGPLDLALGADALAQRMAEAEFPMLSANVVDAATGQSVAPAFVVVAVGDHRVALVGLTRPPRQAPPATAALPNQPGLASEPVGEFRVLDPAQAAAEAVAQAAPQADTVILLTNLEYRAALALVEGLPEVDLVVAALPTQLPQMAVRSATGALVVVADQSMPRHSGRRVGRLMVTMESDGRLTGEQWESIPMDGTVADDLAMQALLAAYAQP